MILETKVVRKMKFTVLHHNKTQTNSNYFGTIHDTDKVIHEDRQIDFLPLGFVAEVIVESMQVKEKKINKL